MTTFTGSDTWHATIVGPDPNDEITAASVVDGDTLLADRTFYLRARLGETSRVISYGETVLAGTASLIDLKAITTLTPVPGLESAALPALEASDLLVARVHFGVTLDGASAIHWAIDHDADPLVVAAEYRHGLSATGAVLTVGCDAMFAIGSSVATGSKLRAVARVAAGGNTTSEILRAASLRWELYRKALP